MKKIRRINMGNYSVHSLEQSYFPTVSELLENPAILNSRLVAGAAGLDRKVSACTVYTD